MNLQDRYNKKVNLYSSGINSSILPYIEKNKKILDVGCSTGDLGLFLKKNKNATVSGFDISTKAIKAAKKSLEEAYVINIDTDALPFKKKSFDIIICADVLEHLYDPLAVMKKLTPYLKKDGIFILSIPNIANIKIRWDLLMGKFEYTEKGILDNTHVRFFTRKNVENLVRDAKLKINHLDYTVGFTFFLLNDKYIQNYPFLQTIKYKLTKLIPNLACTQFIVVASK